MLANIGPVAMSYQVTDDFRHYAEGIFTSTICNKTNEDVNHAVLAVGYNDLMEEEGLPYYVVKNSWGDQWGMSGYFYIIAYENMCALSACNSYPDGLEVVNHEPKPV